MKSLNRQQLVELQVLAQEIAHRMVEIENSMMSEVPSTDNVLDSLDAIQGNSRLEYVMSEISAEVRRKALKIAHPYDHFLLGFAVGMQCEHFRHKAALQKLREELDTPPPLQLG